MPTDLTFDQHLTGFHAGDAASSPATPTAPASTSTCRPARSGPYAASSATRARCTAGRAAAVPRRGPRAGRRSRRPAAAAPTRSTGCATARSSWSRHWSTAPDGRRGAGRSCTTLPRRGSSGRAASTTRRRSTPSTRWPPRSAGCRAPRRPGSTRRPSRSTGSTSCCWASCRGRGRRCARPSRSRSPYAHGRGALLHRAGHRGAAGGHPCRRRRRRRPGDRGHRRCRSTSRCGTAPTSSPPTPPTCGARWSSPERSISGAVRLRGVTG